MNTEELDRAVDETLPSGCGGCGRSLPQPGTQCPQCKAWPDITREEQAAVLSAPGELTLHKADGAEGRAMELMRAFVAAAAVPDRLAKVAEIEAIQAQVQEALVQASRDHAEALGRLDAARTAQAAAQAPLDEALEELRAAEAELEAAERTLAGPRAEVEARRHVAAATPVAEKYKRLYAEAAAVTAGTQLDVENAEIMISMAEQARDEQAARLLYVDDVRPSARRLTMLAHPLVAYAAELVADQQTAKPQYPDEWENLLGLVHALAGAAGLLAMAEEKATPRILQDLTGPLSRAGDLAEMRRRLSASPYGLPPGPGESRLTWTENNLL